MALIVEDGSGLPNAEAYVSIAYTDTYLQKYHSAYYTDTWSPMTTALKEERLRNGAAYLDSKYHGQWKGDRTNKTQAMAWPRIGVEDDDGFYVASNEMPDRLLRANVEAAIRDGLELDVNVGEFGVTSESKSLDVLSKSVTWNGAKNTQKQFPKIDRLLQPYLEGSPGLKEVERG